MAATTTWFSQINKYFKKCLGAFELKADALSMTQFFLEAASFSPHLCHVQHEKAEGVLERLPSYSDVGWRVGAGLGWGSSRDTLSMLKSHCKYSNKNMSLKKKWGEFPGCPMVRTQCFHCWDPNSIPGQKSKNLQAAWYSKKKKKFGLYISHHRVLTTIGSQLDYIFLFFLYCIFQLNYNIKAKIPSKMLKFPMTILIKTGI